jgi:bacterioferritin
VLRVTRATSNVVDQQNVGVIVELEEFVSELNSDLESEYRSIVQCVQHAAVIKGAEHLATIEELRRHLTQELSHAQVLAEQVDFLGGVPTSSVWPTSLKRCVHF